MYIFLFTDYNQQNQYNSFAPGPQDGGFDTSAWGNYTNYYPVPHQNNNNTNNNQPRGNQRPRSNYQNNQQRQQTSNNSVVVCNYFSQGQILLIFHIGM